MMTFVRGVALIKEFHSGPVSASTASFSEFKPSHIKLGLYGILVQVPTIKLQSCWAPSA